MRAIAVTFAALALFVSGCASSGGRAGAGGARGTAVGTPPRKIEVGFAAKGHTVSAHLNDVIEVRLSSTFWRFHPMTGGVLSRGAFVSKAMHGPPGVGAGMVVATFRALKTGTTHITAARSSCGEALRCVGGQNLFTVTVVVG